LAPLLLLLQLLLCAADDAGNSGDDGIMICDVCCGILPV